MSSYESVDEELDRLSAELEPARNKSDQNQPTKITEGQKGAPHAPVKEETKITPARIIQFEINVDEPKRAIRFYELVFGWKTEKLPGPTDYWAIRTGGGVEGGLMRRMNAKASVQAMVEVSSIDDSIRRITESGGRLLTPKLAVPGVGYRAYCQDCEGNIFGILQPDIRVE